MYENNDKCLNRLPIIDCRVGNQLQFHVWWLIATKRSMIGYDLDKIFLQVIIHVIYFVKIPVTMNCWSSMSWNCNLFWMKRKVCVLMTKKCSESILKNAMLFAHTINCKLLTNGFIISSTVQTNWLWIIFDHRSISSWL